VSRFVYALEFVNIVQKLTIFQSITHDARNYVVTIQSYL